VAVWFCALAAFAIWTRQPLVREGLWTDEAISSTSRARLCPSFSPATRVGLHTAALQLLLAGYVRLSGAEETSLKLYALASGFSQRPPRRRCLGIAGPLARPWRRHFSSTTRS
jgi:hypothetical protein